MNGEILTDDPISVNESIVDTMLKIPGLDREKILKVNAFSKCQNCLFLFAFLRSNLFFYYYFVDSRCRNNASIKSVQCIIYWMISQLQNQTVLRILPMI